MGNPFTDTLVKQIKNESVIKFVGLWDRLEGLVIHTYKSKEATSSQDREWASLRPRLMKEYPHWKDALHLYWQGTQIGGEPAKGDPFESLLNYAYVRDFVGNWHAMQTLPAARQALNAWLVDLIKKQPR